MEIVIDKHNLYKGKRIFKKAVRIIIVRWKSWILIFSSIIVRILIILLLNWNAIRKLKNFRNKRSNILTVSKIQANFLIKMINFSNYWWIKMMKWNQIAQMEALFLFKIKFKQLNFIKTVEIYLKINIL